VPSRLAVLIVADLVDYTRLMGEDEARAISAIRELKNKHLEPIVTGKGGEILKRMGDGWIIAFSSVTSAMQSSMEVQTKLAAHPVIKLRMGIHIGEIVEDENDFYGSAVNLAQRLQTEAPPGGIMISQDLHRQLTGELAKAFIDAGSFKLKNIALPVTGFQWRPQTGPSVNTGEVPSISVEPFAYAPENAVTESAAADLRDQLIVRLSRRTGIRVLDDLSSNANDSVYALRGRLRIAGSRGRLNLSLVVRASGNTAWTQMYEGDTYDIFAFCDQLIEKSIADLRIQINAFDDDRIAHLSDDQLSISELRSRAAAYFYKTTVESWDHARQLMERALRLNPDDAMALAMHGEAVIILAAARHERLDDNLARRIEDDLNRAVEISPRSDYIFTSRAYVNAFVKRNAAAARKDLERSLSLSPNYHHALDLLGITKLMEGDYAGAVDDLEEAVTLSDTDPLMPYRLFAASIAYHFMGKDQEAANAIERAILLRPNQRSYHLMKAIACRAAGDTAGAGEAEERVSQLPKEPSILAPRFPLPADKAGFMDQFSPE
jgi:adenylate cyclase